MKAGLRQLLVGNRRLPPYLGQVASHTFTPRTFSAVQKQIMSRSRHVMQDHVSFVQLVFNNWDGTETTTGADATITAAIEYPSGTFTQVTFSGNTSGTIPDGSDLTSDRMYLTIPRGVEFWVRSYYTNTAGIVYQTRAGLSTLGEGATYAASGVVDQTMGGTITPTGGVNGNILYGPCAILGMTTRASFALLGDSRVEGQNDTINSTGANHVGEFARSFADEWAYINLGVGGSGAAGIVTAGASGKRVTVARYCSHVLCNLGINDFNTASGALHLSRIQTIAGLIGKPFFHATVAPQSSSTDSWATTVNQTTDATVNPNRLAFNALLRAGAPGIAGYIELADTVESARDSGIWKAGYTGDGLHENATGFAAIAASGCINPTALSKIQR